jgi:hypothetical protein
MTTATATITVGAEFSAVWASDYRWRVTEIAPRTEALTVPDSYVYSRRVLDDGTLDDHTERLYLSAMTRMLESGDLRIIGGPETRVRVAEGCYAWEVVDELGRKVFRGTFPWKPNAVAVAKLNAELRGATLVVEA